MRTVEFNRNPCGCGRPDPERAQSLTEIDASHTQVQDGRFSSQGLPAQQLPPLALCFCPALLTPPGHGINNSTGAADVLAVHRPSRVVMHPLAPEQSEAIPPEGGCRSDAPGKGKKTRHVRPGGAYTANQVSGPAHARFNSTVPRQRSRHHTVVVGGTTQKQTRAAMAPGPLISATDDRSQVLTVSNLLI